MAKKSSHKDNWWMKSIPAWLGATQTMVIRDSVKHVMYGLTTHIKVNGCLISIYHGPWPADSAASYPQQLNEHKWI